jgi:SRSO17 transposase
MATRRLTLAGNIWESWARSTMEWFLSPACGRALRVYYPVDVEPYTPAHHFEKGEDDPAFRTKLKIALELVDRAHTQGIPFRAVVADNFYGEDRADAEQGSEHSSWAMYLPSSPLMTGGIE